MKVFNVRAAHYPEEVETVLKGLSNPTALSFHEGVLYVAECSKNRISYKYLDGEKVSNSRELTVNQLKEALCKLGVQKSEYMQMPKKHVLQAMLQDLKNANQQEYGRQCMSSHPFEGDQQTLLY